MTSDRSQAADGRRAGPLIVTEDVELLDDLLRLCAAAGAEPEVHHAVPERNGCWEDAPLVLVGDDAASALPGAARRRGVMLVGRDQDDPDVWRRAVEIGADCVLRLPDAENWLVDRIADAAEGVGRPGAHGRRDRRPGRRRGLDVGLCAGRHLGPRRARTMLVDGDPLGGGLDVLLGGEQAEGRRWPDFAASKGRMAGGALEESLPRLHELRVLSWDRGDSVAISAGGHEVGARGGP